MTGPGSGTETPKTTQDLRTRERLIEAAADLFADRGFRNVTVREICAAATANVAAINYHFGDKQGLYQAVVDEAIRVMKETNELSMEAGRGASPEDRIRAYIHVFLERVAARDRQSWIHKLITRAIGESGDAMDTILNQVIEPRMAYLGEAIAEMTGLAPTDRRIILLMMSIQGQVLLFTRPRPARVPPGWGAALSDVGVVADHIADFSLAAIRAMAPGGVAR